MKRAEPSPSTGKAHGDESSLVRNLELKCAAIVGLGNLGAAIAERLRALRMQVWGIKKHPELSTASSSVIDYLGGPRDLGKVLASADFVILTVPLCAETQGLIGWAELARMKPSAFLANVARGPVVS